MADDRQVLINSIRSQLLSLETIRMWEKNPDNYPSGVTNSIFTLMERDFAPVDTRLRAAIARERLIPAVLADGKKNLNNPPKIYTEIALDQIDGTISFFQNDVPEAFAAATDAEEQGGVSAEQRRRDCRAEGICRVDEDGPVAAFEWQLRVWRGHISQEALVRRDG